MDTIQKVFPGAEPTTLGRAKKICVLSDIRVIIVDQQIKEAYHCDGEGVEIHPPLSTNQTEEPDDRRYHCNNCGYESSGTEDFTIQSHLGKFHDITDVF